LQLAPDQPVQRPAVGVREVLGGDQDRLQQRVDVALLGERDADGVEVLEAGEEARLERALDVHHAARRGFGTDLVGARRTHWIPDGMALLVDVMRKVT
jgi:hypothetical protein